MSDVFYGQLVKDAGCSSNAGRVFQLFGGPEHSTKRAVWLRDWRRLSEQFVMVRRRRIGRLAPGAVQTDAGVGHGRQDRQPGALRDSARAQRRDCALVGLLGVDGSAVFTMDEHWDGGGHPRGLRRQQIPLAGRIIGLAQVVEIFWGLGGPQRALEVARARRGTWFDPELGRFLCGTASDALWHRLASHDVDAEVAAAEPAELVIEATETRLDAIARAFAWVIDAKSTFTYRHSERVADIAVRIGSALGFLAPRAGAPGTRQVFCTISASSRCPTAFSIKPAS